MSLKADVLIWLFQVHSASCKNHSTTHMPFKSSIYKGLPIRRKLLSFLVIFLFYFLALDELRGFTIGQFKTIRFILN